MAEQALIGLIGGMSWESSAEYYRIINQEVRNRLGGVHSARSLMLSVDFGEIRMVVSLDVRGKGVGKALSQETFALALGAGLEKLSVQMTVDQQAAIALFESLGFKAEALLRDHVRDIAGKTHDIVVLGHNVAQVQAQMEAYGLPGAVQH